MQFRPFHFSLIILCFIFFLGCGVPTRGGSLQTASGHADTANLSAISRSTHSAADLGQFAGTWTAHGAVLIVARDGTATFSARTYRWCGPNVLQPCDTLSAQGQIHNGDQEQILFSRVSGPVAYGTVLASTFQPAGLAVTLTLQPNDTLLYVAYTSIALLCGPNAPAGTCGA